MVLYFGGVRGGRQLRRGNAHILLSTDTRTATLTPTAAMTTDQGRKKARRPRAAPSGGSGLGRLKKVLVVRPRATRSS